MPLKEAPDRTLPPRRSNSAYVHGRPREGGGNCYAIRPALSSREADRYEVVDRKCSRKTSAKKKTG
jgi:hypothetical protein